MRKLEAQSSEKPTLAVIRETPPFPTRRVYRRSALELPHRRPPLVGPRLLEMIGNRPGSPRPVASWMTSRSMLLALALMLAGSWFWRTYLVETPPSPVSYSQFFAWLGDGKVQSVVMNGESVDAALKSPEMADGRAVQKIRTTVAPNDPALL